MCKLQLDAVPLQASLHYPDHFEIMCISSILQNLLFIRTRFVQIKVTIICHNDELNSSLT